MRWTNDTKLLDKLLSNLAKLEKKQVNVGFFDTRYGEDNDNLYVAQVAQWQEEGVPSKNIPPRPMFRTYLFSKVQGPTYKILNKMLLKGVCDGNISAASALESLGDKLKEDLKGIIAEGVPPPNTAEWSKKKGGKPPLNYTGVMQDSVDYKITKKSSEDI